LLLASFELGGPRVILSPIVGGKRIFKLSVEFTLDFALLIFRFFLDSVAFFDTQGSI
jgi:hypothetical protein